MQFNRFYIPRTKRELLTWFKRNQKDWKQSELVKMKKKQLYAIYYKEREAKSYENVASKT